MKRFNTLEELQNDYLKRGMLGAILRAISSKDETADSTPTYQGDGNAVWQLQSTDSDASVAEVFGAPLMELPITRVRYFPDEEQFLCDLAGEHSCQETLVIPDAYWLDDGWRAWLVSQL